MFNTNRVPTTSPDSTPSPDTGASWDSLAQMGRDDPANRTTWDDLAALANQMGKIPDQPNETSPQSNEANAQTNEDTQTNESNTPVNESVSQPGEAPDPLAQRRREVLDYIDSVDFENADTEGQPTQEEILASIRDKTNGLWSSRDFIEAIREKTAQKFGESSTVALMCLGMPAEVVVQNQDYYNEVVNDEYFGGMLSSLSGTFSDFYHVMSATEDGINRFKKDFIESGLAKENASAIINNYIKDDSCSESELMDLAVAKSCGINLLDGIRQPHIHIDSTWRVRSLEKMDENNQTAGQRLANFLYDHDLVDGKDLHVVYSKALGEDSSDTIEQGVIDVAIKRDSAVESDDPDINYWSQLSLQNGKNMIADFLKTSREGQIDNFDFTAEPVMRLFANSLRYGGFQYDWNNTQAQKLRKALENPVFQDIILDRIDAQMQAEEQLIARSRNNPFLRSGSFDANAFPPEGFLLLAQNHKILESMLARNAFVEHGSCKSLKTISWFIEKLEHGAANDADVAKLFTGNDRENQNGIFYDADNFDSDGNLTYEGAKEYYARRLPTSAVKPLSTERIKAGFARGDYSILDYGDGFDVLADLGFDEKQIETLKTYHELGANEQDEFRQIIDEIFDDITVDRIKHVSEIIGRLRNSNSDEISAGANGSNSGAPNLIKQLLLSNPNDTNEEVFEKIDKIEDVFLRNNLPYVGKVFRTFGILYPLDYFSSGTFNSLTTPERIQAAMERGALANLPNHGIRSREAVLWNDLLKATIGSNNRDFIKYINSLETPQHLQALADNTAQGRATGKNPNAFMPTSRYSTADRIVRSFAHGLGYRSFAELKTAVEQIPQQADQRNRERLRRKDFSLQKGDLVKSTSIEYLGSILQNGAVCKEFLNGQAETDGTPLDADVGIFEQDFDSISQAIEHKNNNNAFGAMHCILVMKGDENTGRNRFQHEGDGRYDPNKYEIWDNGGENHGIRVGFPSSEIDFVVYDKLGEPDSYGDLNRIKFEIARNGFFIPIVDKDSGEPVFSEEEYASLRRKMSGLSEYSAGEFIAAPSEVMAIGTTMVNGRQITGTTEVIAESQDNRREVDTKRGAITSEVIKPVLDKFGLEYKPFLDGNITEGSAEIIDTGSTGRYSNAPHDGDFDFMMKLDKRIYSDQARMSELRDDLFEQMGITDPAQREAFTVSGNIRATGIKLDGLEEPVDIDITFAHKTNKVQYSTDMALGEFYESMSPEVREQVVANVVFAKKFLKAAGVYKNHRKDETQGGLGGVGVENWVLQNGGSFIAAAREFMSVAERCGDGEEGFSNFCSQYAVWDFGENHMNRGAQSHDNFVVDNMNARGYTKMKAALSEFLSQIPQ